LARYTHQTLAMQGTSVWFCGAEKAEFVKMRTEKLSSALLFWW